MSLLLHANPPDGKERYQWVGPIQSAMWQGFWTSEKFKFDADVIHYTQEMSPALRETATRAIALIAQVEVKVKKYWALLSLHLKDETIIGGGITMAGVEEIHHAAYKKLLHKLGIASVIESVMEVPVVAARVNYLTKHMTPVYGTNPGKQLAYSLTLFTGFVEYVSLFAPFATILHMERTHGYLTDTAQQVKYTRNEETLHAYFGAGIINELRREHPELFDEELKARIYEEVRVAYECEAKLIDWMLEHYNEPDFNPAIVKNYVKERFNEFLEMIGYEAQFELDPAMSAQTFWMKVGVYAPPKVDFFHSEPTGYIQVSSEDDDF